MRGCAPPPWLLLLALLVRAGASLLGVGSRAIQSPWRLSPPRASLSGERRTTISLDIDLGPSGEPKGVNRINFTPLLPDSEIFVLELGLPLGMLIRVVDDGGGSIAGTWFQNTRVVVEDALPGFSACKRVKKGDLVRAVSAYRPVMVAPEGFSAWRQLTSYTPVGEMQLRRLIFKTEGASYEDVRDAIKSHNEGNRIATLVIERARTNNFPDSQNANTAGGAGAKN